MTVVAIELFAGLMLAARRRASSADPDATLFAVLAVGAIFIVFLIIKAIADGVTKKHNAKLDALADEHYRKWRAAVERTGGNLQRIDNVPIKLQKGEVCFFYDKTATLLEPRAVRQGSYGGGSVRLMRGVSIHTGSFGSESHDEWRLITTGSLYVTNKRIIFDGAMKNRIVKMSDVMSVARDYRAAIVNSSALQKPLGFGSINGQVFADVVTSISRA